METSTKPVEIKFRVDPAEKAEAERVSRHIGMTLNEAMKVMFRRFLAERGFPFEMRENPRERAAEAPSSVLGLAVSRMAELARNAGAEAATRHLREGRPISYLKADGTLVRELSDGTLETLASGR